MRTALVLSVVLLAGCSAVPTKPTPSDPFEPINRTTHRFNQAVDRAFLKPLARGYDYFTPRPLRTPSLYWPTNRSPAKLDGARWALTPYPWRVSPLPSPS